MNDVLKPLLENELLSEEAKEQIQEAWAKKLDEVREETEVKLREEFAARYEHDKGILTDAVERMVEDGLRTEIAEFAEDRKKLAEQHVKLANEIREARITAKTKLGEQLKILEAFVLENLGREIKDFEVDRQEVREAKKNLAKELRESRVRAKKEFAKSVEMMEGFVLNQLKTELSEFNDDKQALVKQRVKMIEEGKAKIESTRKEFIKRSANLVESTVEDLLRKELTQFRNDIERSRQNAFGSQLFEAFAAEFKTSFFKENTEVKQLQKKVSEASNKLAKAKKLFEASQEIAGKAEKRQKLAEGRAERTVVMNELLGKLSGKQKEVMAELLGGIKTNKLREAFKKYIPAVTNGTGNTVLTKRVKTETLSESKKIVTGDKTNKLTEAVEVEDADANNSADIYDLKRLAGIQ